MKQESDNAKEEKRPSVLDVYAASVALDLTEVDRQSDELYAYIWKTVRAASDQALVEVMSLPEIFEAAGMNYQPYPDAQPKFPQ